MSRATASQHWIIWLCKVTSNLGYEIHWGKISRSLKIEYIVTLWHIFTSSLYPSASALTMILPTFGISTSETSFSVCLCLTGTSCCCSCCCSSSSFCASCSGASPEASGSSWAGRLRPATFVSSFSSWRSDAAWLLSSASGPGVCKKKDLKRCLQLIHYACLSCLGFWEPCM